MRTTAPYPRTIPDAVDHSLRAKLDIVRPEQNHDKSASMAERDVVRPGDRGRQSI